MGKTLRLLLNVATFGAEIRVSGKSFQYLTTLYYRSGLLTWFLEHLTKSFLECPLKSLWGREKNFSAGVLYSSLINLYASPKSVLSLLSCSDSMSMSSLHRRRCLFCTFFNIIFSLVRGLQTDKGYSSAGWTRNLYKMVTFSSSNPVKHLLNIAIF